MYAGFELAEKQVKSAVLFVVIVSVLAGVTIIANDEDVLLSLAERKRGKGGKARTKKYEKEKADISICELEVK